MLGQVDVHRVDADRLHAAQVVEAAVARDPIEPRAHVDLALVREDRVEGSREDLLQHVLGILARAEHVPAEGVQARLVARDERFERSVVAATHERDQAFVRLETEQRGPAVQAPDSCVFEC